MSKIDLINSALLDVGFIIDDIKYKFEHVISVQHVIVNGKHHQVENKGYLHMLYIGDGCEVDETHNEIEGTEMCGFDILDEEDGFPVHTVFVDGVEQLRSFLRLW